MMSTARRAPSAKFECFSLLGWDEWITPPRHETASSTPPSFPEYRPSANSVALNLVEVDIRPPFDACWVRRYVPWSLGLAAANSLLLGSCSGSPKHTRNGQA